jgi:cyclomaltodextrinase
MRIRYALTVLFCVVAILICMAAGNPPKSGAQPADSALKKVPFTFEATKPYNQVFLAGTFNGWKPDATPMHRTDDHWEVTLFLAKGEYRYKFVADGEWITDMKAKKFYPDGYGGQNSAITVDDSFEDFALRRGDGEITTEGLRHTNEAWERTLNPDGTVTIRVRTWMGDVETVDLCFDRTGAGETSWQDFDCVPMNRYDSDGTYDYYESTTDIRNLTYYFRLTDGGMTLIFDRQGARKAPSGALNLFHFDATGIVAFSTPDWVKEGIIYQIFPERFANGDKANDPDFSEWYYKGLTELPPSGKVNGEYFHLVTDWYDVAGLQVSPYRTDGNPDWDSFYGGDIAGVRQNLDYLEDLGITVIYFNPIFKAKSNHKYDAATYMEVDPHFGTNEEFAGFVADCHARGIRVILDLAYNHTGHTYFAFVDSREKGQESEYWNWYEWKKWPVPGPIEWTPPNPSEYYECWWNFGQMPNLNFDLARSNPNENSVVDISNAKPNWPMVNHLLDATEYWLREADVDGYRLDVPNEVPFWFWQLFRERVKTTKPDAYIVGELWGASPEWVNSRYLDAVMNYKYFRDPVVAFFAKGEIPADEFDRAIAPGRLTYPEEGVRAMMNLLGSHDTERFLTVAGGDTRRLKLAMLFGMTYVGAPTVYYGDEVAMEGRGDPDCRRPFYWRWPEEAGRAQVHDYVRSLISLRKDHPCLVSGSFKTLFASDRIYVYRRMGSAEEALVVFNTDKVDRTVKLALDTAAEAYTDPLDGTSVPVRMEDEGPTVTVELPALSGRVLLTGQTGG